MPSGPYFRVTSIRFTASALYCTALYSNFIFSNGDIHPQENGLLAKISLSDGSIQWTAPFTYLFGNDPLLILSPDEQDVLLFSSWNDQIQVRDYATSDGSELGGKFEPCSIDQCVMYNAIVASDGTLRMVNDTTDYVSGSQFQMIIMQKEFDEIFKDGFGG
jgi:carbohydrate-binding DOMON domain-containing protein